MLHLPPLRFLYVGAKSIDGKGREGTRGVGQGRLSPGEVGRHVGLDAFLSVSVKKNYIQSVFMVCLSCSTQKDGSEGFFHGRRTLKGQ